MKIVICCEDSCSRGGPAIDSPCILVPTPIMTIELLKERRVVDVQFIGTNADDGAFASAISYPSRSDVEASSYRIAYASAQSSTCTGRSELIGFVIPGYGCYFGSGELGKRMECHTIQSKTNEIAYKGGQSKLPCW